LRDPDPGAPIMRSPPPSGSGGAFRCSRQSSSTLRQPPERFASLAGGGHCGTGDKRCSVDSSHEQVTTYLSKGLRCKDANPLRRERKRGQAMSRAVLSSSSQRSMKRPSGNWGSHPTQQTEYRGGGAVPNAPKVDEHDLRALGVPTPHNGLNTEGGNNPQRRGGAGSPQHPPWVPRSHTQKRERHKWLQNGAARLRAILSSGQFYILG